MKEGKSITVKGIQIGIKEESGQKFISLTDMIRGKEGVFFISDWLRNRNTIEFIGIWEVVNNQNFNYGEFAIIKSQAGLNSYRLSVKEWVDKTNAIGLQATAGKYGGTYAHIDIAFEFGMWISAEFKIYLIKEFQRLKENESIQLHSEWNIQRILSKVNYKILTDSIKEKIIPHLLTQKEITIIYALEADILNMALFGKTARQWKIENTGKEGNIRDWATLEQLVVLSNLESINSVLIHQELTQKVRLIQLNSIAIGQMKSLYNHVQLKYIKKIK
ncbi:MAG: KilA-N domain-containing protein [Bacteroidota bacterium]